MGLDWTFLCDSIIQGIEINECVGKDWGITYLRMLMIAWGWTAAVSVCGLFLALIFGTFIGVLRSMKGARVLNFLGAAYVELFRNIPLLVQIFLWYHVLPAIFPALKDVPGFYLVVCALGFFTSARIAEQIRAGIGSLPRGQHYAAQALGLTTAQSYRLVILPLTFRIILPPLTSESMGIIKNSSVAYAVSVAELTSFAVQTQEDTSQGTEVYLIVTILYIITALIVYGIMTFIEKMVKVPGLSAASSGGH